MNSLRQSLAWTALLVCFACTDGRVEFPPVGDTDAGSCGALGSACCANASCGAGLSCEANVCQQGRTGEIGKTCARNGDCRSGICIPLTGGSGNVCTVNCANAGACTAGWLCGSLEGSASNVCQCSPSSERCDGLDNDCDGIVDNQPAVDTLCVQENGTGNQCLEGACQLPGCQNNGDCLGAQICDPITKHCVLPMTVDAGPGEPDAGTDAGTDAGVDAGRPDGGVDGGMRDAGSPDGGSGAACLSRYDCDFGEACRSWRCTAIGFTSCSQTSECARGEVCGVGGFCIAGCADGRDCEEPESCFSGQCATCGRDHACPSGQYCSTTSGVPACVTSASCSSSSTCNSSLPGTLCSSGSCRNCTGDSDCQNSPYGSGYTCSTQGFCTMGSMTCDAAQCSNTCYPQGRVCDTSNCLCTGTTGCNNANCGGSVCGAGKSCDTNSCTCTQNSACGGSTWCATVSGLPFSLCALQSGACDSNCNCNAISTCTSNSDCGTKQICVDSGCHDIAVDSSNQNCTLTKCRASNHPCKNANTGAGCICSNANSDGFSGTTSPVSCD